MIAAQYSLHACGQRIVRMAPSLGGRPYGQLSRTQSHQFERQRHSALAEVLPGGIRARGQVLAKPADGVPRLPGAKDLITLCQVDKGEPIGNGGSRILASASPTRTVSTRASSKSNEPV